MRKTFLWVVVVAAFFAACDDREKSGPGTPPAATSPFRSISAGDGASLLSGEIDDAARTVDFAFERRNRLDTVTLHIVLNEGFRLDEANTLHPVCNLEEPFQLTVLDVNAVESVYSVSAATGNPFRQIELSYKTKPVTGVLDGYTVSFPVVDYTADAIESLPAQAVAFELNSGYEFEETPAAAFDFTRSETAGVYTASQRMLIRNTETGRTFRYKLQASVDRVAIAETSFDIYTGVNLSYWIDPGQGVNTWAFNEEMAEQLKELGYDHVRIPVYDNALYNEDGSKNDGFFDMLLDGIGWCTSRGLKVIIDLHGIQADVLRGGPEDEQVLYDFWDKMSRELKAYDPGEVAYELLNEVGDAMVPSDIVVWNRVLKNAIHVIRTHDTERVIFVGSVGNDYSVVDRLSVPQGDPNLFISFHYYRPMPLTHYGLSVWTDFNGIVYYPGRVVDRDEFSQLSEDIQSRFGYYQSLSHSKGTIDAEFYKICEFVRKKGLRVHCGEYACSSKQGHTYGPRVQWYADMIDEFKTYDIPHTHWESTLGRGGIFSLHYSWGDPVTEILDVVTQGRGE